MVLTVVETAYIDSQGGEISGEEMQRLFPREWFGFSDISLKIKILSEAIDKKVKIVDTDLYQKTFGGKIR